MRCWDHKGWSGGQLRLREGKAGEGGKGKEERGLKPCKSREAVG